MGDPRKVRKKYETPRHPWVGSRIAEEKKLVYAYGLRNKAEVWRMGTTLKRFKDRAKRLLAQSGKQAQVEQQQLLERLTRLGLIKQEAGFDDVLGLPIEAIMDRRLQTILIRKHLARTPKQARQMITHRHVKLGGKVVTSPSHLVTLDDEASISFAPRSAFVSEQHPERFSEEELLKKKAKLEAKAKKAMQGEAEEAATFDEKAIENAEVLAGEKKVDSVKDVVKEEKAEKQAEKKDAPGTPVTRAAAPADPPVHSKSDSPSTSDTLAQPQAQSAGEKAGKKDDSTDDKAKDEKPEPKKEEA